MSEKIPYYFETPIPKYFRENGWYSNINTILFLTWAFSRCSLERRTIVHDCKEIILEPFEFITGRAKSSNDSLISVEAFRHQLNTMQKAGLLKKTPNSTPNRFTCYRWVTSRFSKDNPQLNHQLTPNSPPTEPPQSIIKKDTSNNVSNIEDAQPAKQPRQKDLLTFNFQIWEFEGISEKDIAEWKRMYPHIDIQVEILKASQWLRNNPSKSNKLLWRKFLTGWFGRTNDTQENKKAYRSATTGSGTDRRTKDRHGNPVENQYAERF